MDYTVYKKSEEVEDEYVGKGAKKKKQKGSKEPSPGKPTDVFIQKFLDAIASLQFSMSVGWSVRPQFGF